MKDSLESDEISKEEQEFVFKEMKRLQENLPSTKPVLVEKTCSSAEAGLLQLSLSEMESLPSLPNLVSSQLPYSKSPGEKEKEREEGEEGDWWVAETHSHKRYVTALKRIEKGHSSVEQMTVAFDHIKKEFSQLEKEAQITEQQIRDLEARINAEMNQGPLSEPLSLEYKKEVTQALDEFHSQLRRLSSWNEIAEKKIQEREKLWEGRLAQLSNKLREIEEKYGIQEGRRNFHDIAKTKQIQQQYERKRKIRNIFIFTFLFFLWPLLASGLWNLVKYNNNTSAKEKFGIFSSSRFCSSCGLFLLVASGTWSSTRRLL
eukprot:TRINITY_DN4496_c0_g1_i1.p1 TRINITY_DN4496_c0_g1~~TRINITY_DN4496_c0_g1_i1.p1  ORF type:complete len:317 (-),score=88.74 TRINITY_DN4496_c0_g1_i1:74-1024(-)